MAKISLHGNNSNLSTGGLTATVNWPDGTSQTSSQQTIQVINSTNSTTYDVKAPIIFSFGTPINLVAGLVTNICPAGQTFNYVNQTTNVNAIGITGIQSFDTDISTLSGLVYLFIGGYYNSTTWNGVPTSPVNENIYLTSFTTILPISTNDHYITITKNQLNITTFNPTYTSKTNRLTFTNNPGQTSPITIGSGHGLETCTITNNPSLQSVTVNSTGYLTTINLSSNILNSFTINGLNLNTGLNKSATINLEYNQLTTLPANCISSYPPVQNFVSIQLKGNKFQTFNYNFTGLNMNVLELDNQMPSYSQLSMINDASTINTTFKTISIQNNNISRCPTLPTTLTTFKGSGNPIFAEPNLPNLTSGLVTFQLNNVTPSPHTSDLTNWTPNTVVGPNHTALQDITTLTNFEITKTILPIDGWKFQFSNLIGPGTASIPSSFLLSNATNLVTLDMTYLGSFRSCIISNNTSLVQLDNLTTRTLLKKLNIQSNKFSDSGKIIPNSDPWPPSLYYLNVCNNTPLTSWSKSFAGFNTSNSPASQLFFYGTSLSNNSVAFIIGNLVTATTLTNGILSFTSSSISTPVLNNPDPETVNCLNCLTATTSTPCVSPATGNGRNWTVGLVIT